MCDCDGQNLSNPAVKQCFKLVSKWPARHSDWFVSAPVCGVNVCYSSGDFTYGNVYPAFSLDSGYDQLHWWNKCAVSIAGADQLSWWTDA